jgi:hypothetical protein
VWTPEPDKDGKRRYRRWAGCPKGTPEDESCCIVSVADGGRSVLSHQCNRKRGHGPGGLYCKQHAKRAAT